MGGEFWGIVEKIDELLLELGYIYDDERMGRGRDKEIWLNKQLCKNF